MTDILSLSIAERRANLRRRPRGECSLDYAGRQIYKCPASAYWITEPMCDGRQAHNYERCQRCSVRKGAKNDPRA